MSEQTYHKPSEAAKLLGVSVHTLRYWDRHGQIRSIRTPSGQRRYDINSYYEINMQDAPVARTRTIVAYSRVSSHRQKADLDRQIAAIKCLYPDADIITDIASGLNYRRKGLLALLERVRKGNVATIVVAHKDRLTRFGFELIKWWCEQDNCSIVVLNQDGLSPEREMVEDILAIIHIFSCRLYGLRKYKSAIKEDLEIQIQLSSAEQGEQTKPTVKR